MYSVIDVPFHSHWAGERETEHVQVKQPAPTPAVNHEASLGAQ